MRLPGKGDMQKLTMLSQARERLAMVELADVTARRNAAAARVRDLQSQTSAAAKSGEAAVFEKWLLWRDQELARRLGHLARVSAEYAEASNRCGRVIAENAVVETVADLAVAEAKDAAEKSGLYEIAMTSHLLANDVGDEDV